MLSHVTSLLYIKLLTMFHHLTIHHIVDIAFSNREVCPRRSVSNSHFSILTKQKRRSGTFKNANHTSSHSMHRNESNKTLASYTKTFTQSYVA